MSKQEAFCVSFDPSNKEQTAAINEFMVQVQDDTAKYIEELATELNLTYSQAADVWYLRSRSRHTEELEARLIKAMRAGHSLPVGSGEEREELDRLGF